MPNESILGIAGKSDKMTKEQYWYCECIYDAKRENVLSVYVIKNGLGDKIAEDEYSNMLEDICKAHNLCILNGEE